MAEVTFVKWNPGRISEAAAAVLEKRMERACILVRDSVKRSINRGNIDGKNPSREGEPPKKVTARLFNSITYAVVRTKGEILGAVGTNVVYARRLELGFVGVDAAGRKISQGPRPFLKPGVTNNVAGIKRELGLK